MTYSLPPTLRALLAVLKWLPPFAAAQRRELQDTLLRLLRTTLLRDPTPPKVRHTTRIIAACIFFCFGG